MRNGTEKGPHLVALGAEDHLAVIEPHGAEYLVHLSKPDGLLFEVIIDQEVPSSILFVHPGNLGPDVPLAHKICKVSAYPPKLPGLIVRGAFVLFIAAALLIPEVLLPPPRAAV